MADTEGENKDPPLNIMICLLTINPDPYHSLNSTSFVRADCDDTKEEDSQLHVSVNGEEADEW